MQRGFRHQDDHNGYVAAERQAWHLNREWRNQAGKAFWIMKGLVEELPLKIGLVFF